MEKFTFLENNFINKEIAFIFDIPYRYTSDINNSTLYFASNDNEKKLLEESSLKYLKNYIDLNYLCDYLDQYNRKNEIKDRTNFERDINIINLIPLEDLSLSEMLIKVLHSKPKDIDCQELIIQASIDDDGNVWGCCPHWISKPFGNLLYDEDCYNNYYSRIIKLSYLNKTFCFCNLKCCKYFNSKETTINENIDLKINNVPEHIVIGVDKTCNLRCNSCRKEFYVPTKEKKQMTHQIVQKILETKWLDTIPFMLAGQGEIFFSEEYLNLLKTDKRRKHINILTNATLFNEEKWKLIENKYESITVSISIDAAKKETYSKLRHGSFDAVIKNLHFLSKLRKENKINWLSINFVVQKENMNEMIDFINLAKENNVDRIQFTKLNNWGTMTNEEYKELSLLENDYLTYDLYKMLSNPIFNDKIIDISSFKNYYEKSKIIYES